MANGHQMEQAIAEATEQVAREGWANADQRALTLAGFGYIAHKVERPNWIQVRSLLGGAFVLGGTAGAGAFQAIMMIL